MNPLYPNEAQARRYLVYWQILVAQKRNSTTAAERAATYLGYLPPEAAINLASEFKFPWPPSTTS